MHFSHGSNILSTPKRGNTKGDRMDQVDHFKRCDVSYLDAMPQKLTTLVRTGFTESFTDETGICVILIRVGLEE